MNQAGIVTASDRRQLSLVLVPMEPTQDVSIDMNDPKSIHYRYADTGYIAGSRKEEAASQVILRAKRDGLRVHAQAIDWPSLETNPREARDLITKSNLFGLVDWDGLRAAGLQPAAGFLIDRVYAAIGQAPAHDDPQARQDYTFGLQALRDRVESCRTVDEAVEALAQLRAEMEGIALNSQEAGEMANLGAQHKALEDERRALEKVSDAAYKAMNHAHAEHTSVIREIESRKRRGWKISPELEARLATAKAATDARKEEWLATREGSAKSRRDEIDRSLKSVRGQIESLYAAARVRNQAESPFHRALNLMGERLIKVLMYRHWTEGSEAFAKHVAGARAGLLSDWSWLESEVSRAPRVTKESVRFQFKVADNFERVGGRSVVPGSTAELKGLFGLRDVQSGNWVQRDIASAKFHTEQTAAAFADLADLMGIADRDLSHGGRLAMAFGARGRGATGPKGVATTAHYERIHRVVNITKEKGGGSLGHEWFHALDNLIVEIVTGKPGTADFVTVMPDMLPAGELRNAFRTLRDVMTSGDHQATRTLAYTAEDVKLAAWNLRADRVTKIPSQIRNAGNLADALQRLEQLFGHSAGEVPKGRDYSDYRNWRRLAIAYYGGNSLGGQIEVRTGPKMSLFKAEAIKLDATGKPYFAEIHEMAARAFQAWIEDRLAEQGRRNDYLSVYADNMYCVDPVTGVHWKPYPEGEERKRINAAFDQLAAAVRKHLQF